MASGSVGRTIPFEAFRFSGQSELTTWTLRTFFEEHGWPAYDAYLSHEPELCFQRMRELVDAFPTRQRRGRMGRPSVDERHHLIGMLVRQFMNATFRQTESYLRILKDYFRIERVPDHSTFSKKNRTHRFRRLLDRFHAFILSRLAPRKSVLVTDATGYGNRKRPWRETDYGLRALRGFLKAHVVVEAPSLLILTTRVTRASVHDSLAFRDVWKDLPSTVRPVRSLADAAYSGHACVNTAHEHGASVFHALRKSAVYRNEPRNAYERLVYFARHFPNRFRKLAGWRALAETAFNCTKQRFGHQLRCRHPIARENEIRAKHAAHNLRMIALRETLASA